MSAQLLWNHSTEFSWNFVVMKDLICGCSYPQEILIQFYFLGVMLFMNLEIWPKLKILLRTIPQRNSTEIAQKNFTREQFISPLTFGQNYFVQLRWNWFSVRLPVTNAWNCHSLYTACILTKFWSMGYVSLLTLSFINIILILAIVA